MQGTIKQHEGKRHLNYSLFFVIIVVALLAVGAWFYFFREVTCSSWGCFNTELQECDKVTFVGGTDMIFEYKILGSNEGDCVVNVKLLQGELNDQDSLKLEEKSMECSLPLGVVMFPESNLKNCHGLLKEDLQELFIAKLHTYIVQNLGRINLEAIDIPKEVAEALTEGNASVEQ